MDYEDYSPDPPDYSDNDDWAELEAMMQWAEPTRQATEDKAWIAAKKLILAEIDNGNLTQEEAEVCDWLAYFSDEDREPFMVKDWLMKNPQSTNPRLDMYYQQRDIEREIADQELLDRDPYKYYGVRRSDF